MVERSDGENRAFFRLRYPRVDRPVVRIAGLSFQVAEISEGGVEILIDSEEKELLEKSISGEVFFGDGEKLLIEGDVMRSSDKGVILKLSEGISMKRMVAEQLYLRRKYPESNNDG